MAKCDQLDLTSNQRCDHLMCEWLPQHLLAPRPLPLIGHALCLGTFKAPACGCRGCQNMYSGNCRWMRGHAAVKPSCACALKNRELEVVRTAFCVRYKLVHGLLAACTHVQKSVNCGARHPAQHLLACLCDVPCASPCSHAKSILNNHYILSRSESDAHAAERRATHPR